MQTSVVVAHELSCSTACGIKPVSPALAGGFLTTAPPGKSVFRFPCGPIWPYSLPPPSCEVTQASSATQQGLKGHICHLPGLCWSVMETSKLPGATSAPPKVLQPFLQPQEITQAVSADT